MNSKTKYQNNKTKIKLKKRLQMELPQSSCQLVTPRLEWSVWPEAEIFS